MSQNENRASTSKQKTKKEKTSTPSPMRAVSPSPPPAPPLGAAARRPTSPAFRFPPPEEYVHFSVRLQRRPFTEKTAGGSSRFYVCASIVRSTLRCQKNDKHLKFVYHEQYVRMFLNVLLLKSNPRLISHLPGPSSENKIAITAQKWASKWGEK